MRLLLNLVLYLNLKLFVGLIQLGIKMYNFDPFYALPLRSDVLDCMVTNRAAVCDIKLWALKLRPVLALLLRRLSKTLA